jgi:hypothetical protein
MKFSRSSFWAQLSLFCVLALAPLSASAQRDQVDPVARTKPVIDHAHTHKQLAHKGRHAHMHDAAQRHQQQHRD